MRNNNSSIYQYDVCNWGRSRMERFYDTIINEEIWNKFRDYNKWEYMGNMTLASYYFYWLPIWFWLLGCSLYRYVCNAIIYSFFRNIINLFVCIKSLYLDSCFGAWKYKCNFWYRFILHKNFNSGCILGPEPSGLLSVIPLRLVAIVVINKFKKLGDLL